jgi:hypothetical protein
MPRFGEVADLVAYVAAAASFSLYRIAYRSLITGDWTDALWTHCLAGAARQVSRP